MAARQALGMCRISLGSGEPGRRIASILGGAPAGRCRGKRWATSAVAGGTARTTAHEVQSSGQGHGPRSSSHGAPAPSDAMRQPGSITRLGTMVITTSKAASRRTTKRAPHLRCEPLVVRTARRLAQSSSSVTRLLMSRPSRGRDVGVSASFGSSLSDRRRPSKPSSSRRDPSHGRRGATPDTRVRA